MDIVFAADDNYAAYLCVAAKSVEAAHPDTEIRFHVLDAGISEANRAAVAANLRGGGNIRFIDVNPEDFAGFPLNIRHISITTYARLKLGEYIADCDKVLYLDIDVLVRDSLTPLWIPIWAITGLARALICLSKGRKATNKKSVWRTANIISMPAYC